MFLVLFLVIYFSFFLFKVIIVIICCLNCVNLCLFKDMRVMLNVLVLMLELEVVLKEIFFNKVLSLDGVIIEFFKILWDVIKRDYFVMIIEVIWNKYFFKDVIRGFIFLLFKSG